MLWETIVNIVQVLFHKKTLEAFVLLLLIREKDCYLTMCRACDILHETLFQVELLKHLCHQVWHVRRWLLGCLFLWTLLLFLLLDLHLHFNLFSIFLIFLLFSYDFLLLAFFDFFFLFLGCLLVFFFSLDVIDQIHELIIPTEVFRIVYAMGWWIEIDWCFTSLSVVEEIWIAFRLRHYNIIL